MALELKICWADRCWRIRNALHGDRPTSIVASVKISERHVCSSEPQCPAAWLMPIDISAWSDDDALATELTEATNRSVHTRGSLSKPQVISNRSSGTAVHFPLCTVTVRSDLLNGECTMSNPAAKVFFLKQPCCQSQGSWTFYHLLAHVDMAPKYSVFQKARTFLFVFKIQFFASLSHNISHTFDNLSLLITVVTR